MISVTDLSSYEYCPRKLFLQKILKIKEIPKEALLLGNIMHESFDQISKSEEKLVALLKESSYPLVLQKYKEKCSSILQNVIIKHKSRLNEFNLDLSKTFKNAWDSIFTEAKERALNTSEFMRKSSLSGMELWEKLSPKINSEYRISSEDLKMKGIVDQIRVYPDEVVPYELKTGSFPRTGVWPGHQMQIGAYIMLLKKKGKNVHSGFVNYLDNKELRSVPFNAFLEEKIINLRNEVIKLLESKELPPRIANMKKCNACSLKEKCYDDSFMNNRMKEVFCS